LFPGVDFIRKRLTQTPLQRTRSIWRNQPRADLRPAAKLFTYWGQDWTENQSGRHRCR